MHALATHELTKDYAVGFWRKRPYRALDRLTLDVEAGEVFGFLGPNGAGKTTTLKLLMQLVFPTSGARRAARPAARRLVRQAPHRLPAREPVLLRLPDRRRAARRISRACSATRGAERRARASPAARRGRHRRRAAPAAAQVLEGHAAARRHRAGAHQRSRARDPRRADVGARSARPARRARADPAAARSRLHGLLQLARAERRRGAVQPRRDSGQGPPGDRGPADRDAGVSGARLGAVVAARQRRARPHSARRVRSARSAIGDGRYTSSCRSTRRPIGCSRSWRRRARRLVSLNPIRETLEDFFVQQVTSPAAASAIAAWASRSPEDGRERDRLDRPQRVPRIGARQGALQPRRRSRSC